MYFLLGKLEFVSDLGKRIVLLTTKCQYPSFLCGHLPYFVLYWLRFLSLQQNSDLHLIVT